MNTELSPMMRGLAYAALESAFGPEWIILNSDQQELIAIDAMEAAEAYDSTVRQYRDNIGIGNLASYVECLEIQQRREQP